MLPIGGMELNSNVRLDAQCPFGYAVHRPQGIRQDQSGMVIPCQLGFGLDVLANGLEDKLSDEIPPHRGDNQILVGRGFEKGLDSEFIEGRKQCRVPEGTEFAETPLAGPNIIGGPEIGVGEVVDSPFILIPDRILNVFFPFFHGYFFLLLRPTGHTLRQKIQEAGKNNLVTHEKGRIPSDAPPIPLGFAALFLARIE